MEREKGEEREASPAGGSGNHVQKKLFSEALKTTKEEDKLQGVIQGSFKGCPSVSFTQEDIQLLSKRFAFAFIGTFARRPPYPVVKNFLEKLGLQGQFTIGKLSTNQVIINFQLEEDYQRVFLRQTWFLGNQTMVVTKWTPDYTEGTDCPIVPVWVSCPNLPIYLHDQMALVVITSSLGNPLKVDENTLNFSRPEVARFCVEIDVSKSLPAKIHLKLRGKESFFPLIFEDVPHFCSSCKKLVTRKPALKRGGHMYGGKKSIADWARRK